jgi:hypothetical protein
MKTRALLLATLAILLAALPGRSDDAPKPRDLAITRGIAFLASSQTTDGHFGQTYPVAVTSMAGLAILAAKDDPLHDPTLRHAYAWLKARQIGGSWPEECGTWVHVQGFATLFFAELYGKTLDAKTLPAGLERDELRAIVVKAVSLLEDAQSSSGGWNYRKGEGDEGSTTVCAAQALRAARNFGIPVKATVLARGFAYLKAMQNKDGGFRYQGTQGGSMGAGTAAAVATLVLMSKLDENVLFNGLGFLERARVEGIANGSHGQYGLFYSAMAMKVIGDEYGAHVPLAGRWTRGVEDALVASQEADGSWRKADVEVRPDYGTALSVLTLTCPGGRLSVFNRKAPKSGEDR